jgi:hypothetical protein
MLANFVQAKNFRENLKRKEAGTTTANFRIENIAMWKERLSYQHATLRRRVSGSLRVNALGKFYG